MAALDEDDNVLPKVEEVASDRSTPQSIAWPFNRRDSSPALNNLLVVLPLLVVVVSGGLLVLLVSRRVREEGSDLASSVQNSAPYLYMCTCTALE